MLKWLMPMDMWLYEYASVLFEARWKHLTLGVPYEPPSRPEYPKMTCLSTRFILTCEEGPFGPAFYHQSPTIPAEHEEEFSHLKTTFLQ